MLGLLSFVTKKTQEEPMIHTTTPVFGQNTDESLKRAERLLGEASALIPEDPYLGICLDLWSLLSRKRGYYGCGQEPLENALGVSEEGIEPWVYQLARIGEKCRRLRGMISGGETLAIRETLADIMGHAAVAIACNEQLQLLGEDSDEC